MIIPESRRPIIAIVQGRMSSSRLPGKVLQDIGGQPMLARVVTRVRRAQTIDQVLVATTTDISDDPIAEFCQQRGFPCFRGNLFDVLDRYYQAAKLIQANTVVRITADCPVIAPEEIDRTVNAFLNADVDFAANRLPPPFVRTTPIGMDTEVCSFASLEKAWKNASAKYEREHVMPYLYDQPGRFRTLLVDLEPSYGHLRWTVDNPEDLKLIREIFKTFNNEDGFTLAELLYQNEKHPEWQEITSTVKHKSFLDVDERISTAELGE